MNSDSIPELIKCDDELKNQTFASEGERLMLELHAHSESVPSLQEGFTADISFV